MLGRISSLAAGRRSKWAIVGTWVLLGIALGSFQPKLQEATTNENEAFLPASSESTEVNDLIEERFPDGNEVDALIVYTRPGGLTGADVERINSDALELGGVGAGAQRGAPCRSELDGVLAVVDPFAGPICGELARDAQPAAGGGQASIAAPGTKAPPGTPPTISADESTALLLVRTNIEQSDDIMDNVDLIREVVPPSDAATGELRSYVSGAAGIISDSVETFETIDVTLLLVTVSLVLVLLLMIYRSPVIALVPLFVVGIAYGIAAAAVYGLVKAGVVEVNGQTTSLLIVLMFGAGTDYCLLIVSRFREELRHSEDKHEAMRRATTRTAPAILSAGATVVAAMLVLTLADLKSTQTMGPVLALGIAIMLVAGLTFLPALLALLGRNAFWPMIPRYGVEPRRRVGVWRRVGHFVHDRPIVGLVAVVLFLALGALGNFQDRGSLDFGEGFRNEPESLEGQELIEQNFSAGQAIPTNVIVDRAAAEPVATALQSVDGVEAVAPAGTSEDGELARIDVTLAYDPFSDPATELVPELRETARDAAGSAAALVGGSSPENYDTTETYHSDAKVIVPLVLGLIFLILVVLLRALVAPLYLVATVVLSYAFAVGASALIFTELFNQPDADPGLPTFAFIFLVALGVDYNIFLISRIREESHYREVHDAVITGLEKTGGVITSAGLILVGTFCALMSLPLEQLFQLGFAIALGLLVDTFLVRSILVPSIAFLLGERNWWPGRRSTMPIGPASDG